MTPQKRKDPIRSKKPTLEVNLDLFPKLDTTYLKTTSHHSIHFLLSYSHFTTNSSYSQYEIIFSCNLPLPRTRKIIPLLSFNFYFKSQELSYWQILKGGSPNKRGWESWTTEEKERFFIALKDYGRDFDHITERVSTKNYEQVITPFPPN